MTFDFICEHWNEASHWGLMNSPAVPPFIVLLVFVSMLAHGVGQFKVSPTSYVCQSLARLFQALCPFWKQALRSFSELLFTYSVDPM